jgi:hypothetical protein
MTPSQAILTGSVIIAASIVAAAIVLPEHSSLFKRETAGSPAPAAEKTTAARYQIIKVENDVSWRLDTQTGEITVCRLERERMVCAKSTEAAELPQVSPQQLEAEREERSKARRAERNEVLDKFMAFFERIVRFAQEHSGLSKPPAPQDDRIERL